MKLMPFLSNKCSDALTASQPYACSARLRGRPNLNQRPACKPPGCWVRICRPSSSTRQAGQLRPGFQPGQAVLAAQDQRGLSGHFGPGRAGRHHCGAQHVGIGRPTGARVEDVVIPAAVALPAPIVAAGGGHPARRPDRQFSRSSSGTKRVGHGERSTAGAQARAADGNVAAGIHQRRASAAQAPRAAQSAAQPLATPPRSRRAPPSNRSVRWRRRASPPRPGAARGRGRRSCRAPGRSEPTSSNVRS